MQRQLLEANLKKTPEPIHVVQRLLGEIRDAWAEMLTQPGSAPALEKLAA
jgi:flagellin-specific chaperone FliS